MHSLLRRLWPKSDLISKLNLEIWINELLNVSDKNVVKKWWMSQGEWTSDLKSLTGMFVGSVKESRKSVLKGLTQMLA